jgi:hypothetical protein
MRRKTRVRIFASVALVISSIAGSAPDPIVAASRPAIVFEKTLRDGTLLRVTRENGAVADLSRFANGKSSHRVQNLRYTFRLEEGTKEMTGILNWCDYDGLGVLVLDAELEGSALFLLCQWHRGTVFVEFPLISAPTDITAAMSVAELVEVPQQGTTRVDHSLITSGVFRGHASDGTMMIDLAGKADPSNPERMTFKLGWHGGAPAFARVSPQ